MDFDNETKFNEIVDLEKNVFMLKHKDIEVLEFYIKDGIIYINKILNREHLPYPLIYDFDPYKFYVWLNDRLIPTTRYQYDRFVKTLEIYDANSRLKIIIENNALSLCDCYWVDIIGNNKKWKNINYYENDFNTKLLSFYLATPFTTYKNKLPIIINPAMTLSGYLPKAWTIKNRQRILLKRGTERNIQVYNEICISKIAKECGIKTLEYWKEMYDIYDCSACACFCNNELELVSAMNLTQNVSDSEPLSTQLDNYINLVKNNIPNIETYIDQMLILDYIIANEDRHWNNFGVLRNPETLEIVDIAPLFDYGNSLWYNFFIDCIGNENKNNICANINATDTLKCVKNKNVIDLDKLLVAIQNIKVVFGKMQESELIYNATLKRLNIVKNM